MNVSLYGKQIENPEEAVPGCARLKNYGLCVKETKSPDCNWVFSLEKKKNLIELGLFQKLNALWFEEIL